MSKSNLPGFTAEASLYETGGNYRRSMTFSRINGAVHPAACKCSWLEWIFDPAICAIRELAC